MCACALAETAATSDAIATSATAAGRRCLPLVRWCMGVLLFRGFRQGRVPAAGLAGARPSTTGLGRRAAGRRSGGSGRPGTVHAGGELGDEPARPGEQELDRPVGRDDDEHERGDDRDRVAMHGADQAAEPVPAEPGAPVDRRLEEREAERGRGEERQRPDGEPQRPEPRRRNERASLEREPLAHRHHGEPQHGGRDERRRGDSGGEHDRRGAARPPGRRAPGAARRGWASGHRRSRGQRARPARRASGQSQSLSRTS